MDALVHVFVNEVLTPHCHENGDCQEPDDRQPERSRVWSGLLQSAVGCQSERSRVWSELLQSAGGCQLERSRVLSELHCCQDEGEDEAQVNGCCSA